VVLDTTMHGQKRGGAERGRTPEKGGGRNQEGPGPGGNINPEGKKNQTQRIPPEEGVRAQNRGRQDYPCMLNHLEKIRLGSLPRKRKKGTREGLLSGEGSVRHKEQGGKEGQVNAAGFFEETQRSEEGAGASGG